MRIGAWVHNSGGEFTLLTEEGRELWQSMLEFALDAEHGPGDPGDPEPPVEFEPRVALFLSNPAAPAGADGAMIAYLEEELATEVILLSESLDELTKLEQLDDAEVEAIIISESVTSGNIGAQLNERPEPILVQESFVFDDMFLTGLDSCTGCFAQDDGTGFIFDFGFTSATETQVDITNPDHPILVEAGLADTVDVYSAGGQLHWGYGLGEGAQVLAVPTNGFDNDEDGANDGAVLFVYEADAPLVDGEPAAGMRIGTWVHNSASEFSLMTEDGLALWDATVRYALGLLEAEEPGVTFRRGDNDGNGVVDITDPISSLGYQFLGTFDPPCLDALDWDDNGSVEITDPIGNLTRQFLGGPPAAAPGSEICGVDPTTDAGGGDLGCESYPPCAE
jgi:hypothetical protein